MDINPNLRVSTMTFVSNLGTNIDLKGLFDEIKIDEDVKYIEYGSLNQKGTKINKTKSREKVKKKFFYNQITIHIFDNKIVNVKIFNNGRIQMTGVKSEKQSLTVLNKIIKKIKEIDNEKLKNIIDNLEFNIINNRIAMINTDFDCGFKIKRENLHRIVTGKGYYSSFEPTIYPGVNIKYYYNEISNDGICNCCNPCNGRGKDGFCKKITIAVFNSGKIIITGGQSYVQLNVAYDFIKEILDENKSELLILEKPNELQEIILNDEIKK